MMNDYEKIRLRRIYEEMSEDLLISALLCGHEEYEEEVYDLILEICRNRGLEDEFNQEKAKQIEESEKSSTGDELVEEEDFVPQDDNEEEEGKLKTVATYVNEADAYLALGFLEQNGMAAKIFGNDVRTKLYISSRAGIRLMVREEDFPRAVELLKSIQNRE